MRISILISITLVVTVIGLYGTPVHADGFPGQCHDISDTIRVTDAGNRIVSRSLPMDSDYSGDSARSGAFIKTIGSPDSEDASHIEQTADGGYILAGSITIGSNRNTLVVKLNADGDVVWAKSIFLGEDSHATGIKPVYPSGYCVVGNVGDTAFLLKMTDAGEVLWGKFVFFENMTGAYFNGIDEDNGGYLITGGVNYYGLPLFGEEMIRTNLSGDIMFQRETNLDYLDFNCAQICTGGFIVCGTILDNIEDRSYMFVQKYDQWGNVSWTQQYAPFLRWASGYSITETLDSGYVALGTSYSEGTTLKVAFAKFSNAGVIDWATNLSGTYDSVDMECVHETASGSILAVGRIEQTSPDSYAGYFLKVNSSGTLIAARLIDGDEYDGLTSVTEASDSGYIMTGSTMSWGAGDSDILLIKTSSTGLVPGCSAMEPYYPTSSTPFKQTVAITPAAFGAQRYFDVLNTSVVTQIYPDVSIICEEPTVTPTSTPTMTPTPPPTATTVGCSILCLSSDEDSTMDHVEPALVSTGLLSPPDIFHMDTAKNIPVLADLLPYDAILLWSLERMEDNVRVGDVLKDYVDAGGGVVLANSAFTSDIGGGDIQIAGGILDPGYSPFLPNVPQPVAGQMNPDNVSDPNHAYFDGVNLENIIYFHSPLFSNPFLNDGGVLIAVDYDANNFLAENIDGTVGAVSIYPGKLIDGYTTDDTLRMVVNMLLTVSGCNAEPTVMPTPSYTATPTDTPIPTDTPTQIPTETPTSIPTDTPMPTATQTPVPTMTPTQTSIPCIHHGDVTGDGDVTAADAQLAFEIVMELVVPSFVEECAADCNGDGSITAGDAQQIFGVIFGGSCVDPLE